MKNFIMIKEGNKLLTHIKSRDIVWALDRCGTPWSTKEWACQLNQVRESGAYRLVLIVGGCLGLDYTFLVHAQRKISLGPPTLPHELAALVALEQLYRAHTILTGISYHK